MKQISIYVLLLIFIAYSCGPKEKKFVIEGNLQNVEDSTVIRLCKMSGNLIETIASDTIINGKFHFEGVSDSVPTPYGLLVRGDGFPSTWCEIWLCNNKVSVKGDSKLLQTWTVKSNLKEQSELNKYIETSKGDLDQNQLYLIERNNLFQEMEAEGADRNNLRKKVSAVDSLSKIVSQRIAFRDLDIMNETAISPIWMKKLRSVTYHAKNNTELHTLAVQQFNRLSEEQKASIEGESVANQLFPPKVPEIGDDMVDATLYDLEGNTMTLSALGKDKYMLIDFGSIGCGPCIMAIPETKSIVEDYANILCVVGINVDTEKALWQKFSEEKEINWPDLSDGRGINGGVAAKYGTTGIPYYILVSPTGKVIDKWMGYGQGIILEKIKPIVNK